MQKGYEPCNIDTSINRHPTEEKYVLRRGFVSTYVKCLYVTGQLCKEGFAYKGGVHLGNFTVRFNFAFFVI